MATGTIKGHTSTRQIFSIAANTYSTQEKALEALETAFNSLTKEEKRNSYIIYGNSKYSFQHISGLYTLLYYRDNGATFQPVFINVSSHKVIRMSVTSSGYSMEEEQGSAQSVAMALFVSPY